MKAADVGVVIVAAGSGTRTGSEELKQFRWVAGKPMLLHSVQLFQSRADVAMVVVVLPRRYAGDPPPWLFQSDLNRLTVSVGGATRGASVRNGLEDLPGDLNVVVVHDAARPLATALTAELAISAARGGTGAVAALRVVDTLKRVDVNGRIVESVHRSGMWRAQTPQAFPRKMLEDAYVRAARTDTQATDDASLCQAFGFPVVVVPGSERGFKITTEEDFARADALAMLPG